MKPTDFAQCLTSYLASYLPGQRNVSAHTIKSYRDTFSLFLRYCRETGGIAVERLTLQQIDAALIEQFLDWLEQDRGNSIATRNQRLAALHAFFRYVQVEAPERLIACQRILAIPFKRHAKTPVRHLAADGLQAILAQPDLGTPDGRRDLVLLCVLYDTGARVQELIDLTVRDVRLVAPAVVQLTGKGRKGRHVPLMTRTVTLLETYLTERRLITPSQLDHPLFYNRQRRKLTRAGVTYILNKYVEHARAQGATLPDTVTPHVLRHSKAMHLLQANVNLIYIRDLLGHADVKTTEIYARADTEMKRAALEKVHQEAIPTGMPSWQDDDSLLTWLREFCQSK